MATSVGGSKVKTIFQHVDAIYTNQEVDYFDSLDEQDRKSFNTYMVNRIISMTPEYLPVVNEFQRFLNQVGERETYLFYSQFLPKRKIYSKYVKGAKEERHAQWIIDLVAKYYLVGKPDASYYVSIFYETDEGKRELRSILEKFGTDPKELKKEKL